jgi:hypothetical protein
MGDDLDSIMGSETRKPEGPPEQATEATAEAPKVPVMDAAPSVPAKKHGRRGPRGQYTCSICGGKGHNTRTCGAVAKL